MSFHLGSPGRVRWRRRIVAAVVLAVYLAGSVGLPQGDLSGPVPNVGCQCGTKAQKSGSCCCANKLAAQQSGSCCQKKSAVTSCCSKKAQPVKQQRPSSRYPVLTACDCGQQSIPGVLIVSDPRISSESEFSIGIPLVSSAHVLQMAVYVREADRPVTPPPEGV